MDLILCPIHQKLACSDEKTQNYPNNISKKYLKFSLKPCLSDQWIGKRLLLKSVVSNLFTSIVLVADN